MRHPALLAFAVWQVVTVLGDLVTRMAFGASPADAVARLVASPSGLPGNAAPLFSGILQGLLWLGVGPWLAGRMLTQVCFLLALVLFQRLGERCVAAPAARRAVLLLALSPVGVLLAPVDGTALAMVTSSAALWLAASSRPVACAGVSLLIPLASAPLWNLGLAVMGPQSSITPPWVALAAMTRSLDLAFPSPSPSATMHLLQCLSAAAVLALAVPVGRTLGWAHALLPLCLLAAGLMVPGVEGAALASWSVGSWALWAGGQRLLAGAFPQVLAGLAMLSGTAICIRAMAPG